MMLEIPDKTPQWAKINCDDCGRVAWYRFSRIDPEAWTEKDFLEKFEVNEQTKMIKPK